MEGVVSTLVASRIVVVVCALIAASCGPVLPHEVACDQIEEQRMMHDDRSSSLKAGTSPEFGSPRH